MKALITGASSGIGKDMAIYLSSLGHEVILVSRDDEALKKVQKNIKGKSRVIVMDLNDKNNCIKLHKMVEKDNIDILINNAGF